MRSARKRVSLNTPNDSWILYGARTGRYTGAFAELERAGVGESGAVQEQIAVRIELVIGLGSANGLARKVRPDTGEIAACDTDKRVQIRGRDRQWEAARICSHAAYRPAAHELV